MTFTFLAVQNSSIGDLVTDWLTQWATFDFFYLKTDPWDIDDIDLNFRPQFSASIFDLNFDDRFLELGLITLLTIEYNNTNNYFVTFE